MDTLFVDTAEAAKFLHLSGRTLEDWRRRRIGQPYLKFGQRVRYARDDLIQWSEKQRHLSDKDDDVC